MLYTGQECETAFENDGALRPWCLCKPGRGARQEAVSKHSEKIEAGNGNKHVGSVCFGRQESFPWCEPRCGAEPHIAGT